MTSELSIFATRLRAFMDISMEDYAHLDAASAQALAQHADAEFNGMALVLFALQFTRNEPYRRLCEARGVSPNAVSHWSEIPAMPTSAFKELELSCLPPAERTQVFHSSGTTEQRPSRHSHNAESLALYEASLWAWFRENLRSTICNLRVLGLTPPPVQAPHSSLVHMFDVIRRKLIADENAFVGRVGADGAWTLNFDAAFTALMVEDSKPLLVLGTAFSFVHLVDEVKARNLRVQLPGDSWVMETGGYKGRSRELPKEELHALITERLGVPASHIVCEYGMSELSSQAYLGSGVSGLGSGEVSRAFHFPPWARAQVVSPETGREVAQGETGLLRVFDLANVFSVMAIQTEDLAVRRGDGFELFGRAKLAEPRGCSLMAVENS
jgi:Acyl-protein synthetase, LuxE